MLVIHPRACYAFPVMLLRRNRPASLPAPPALGDALSALLPPRRALALLAAYRATPSPAPSLLPPTPDALLALAAHPERNRATLREIAAVLFVSRERARQILARARSDLASSPAADRLLAPLRDAVSAWLDASGGALAPADLLAPPPALAPLLPPFTPAAALLLLHDLSPLAPPHLHRSFYSLHPPQLLEAVEAFLLEHLLAGAPLLPLAEIAPALHARLPAIPPAHALPLLLRVADSLPSVLLTLAGEAGLRRPASAELLRSCLAPLPAATIPDLVQRFNLRVRPASQLGSGHIRALLLRDPLVRRVSPGHYALPTGHQTSLPLHPTPEPPDHA